MSRRSPTNERYQKYTGPKGQTRKSAAAAKPSRKAAAGSSASKSSGKSKATQPGGKYYEPATPEYKFWRRMWWIALGVGLVLVAVSFYIQYYMKDQSWSRTVGLVTIALAYAAIIAAFIIDWRILRRMRTGQYVAKKPSKPSADKPSSGDTSE